MQEERLQKYMARCGVDSRRKCEELITAGQVEVNGEVVREPGVKIDPARDRIKVNGKVLRQERPAYYIHYKVKGVTTTVSDDLGRKTVMDCLPDIRERVYPVGRLDKESEGLIVLTNDGALANYLTHPAHGIEKTYRVVAEGRVPEDTLRTLAEKGIRLGPVLIKPSRVELVRYDNDNTVALISVAEGINREVRRIFAALGHEVKKLLRTQVGPLQLTGMKRGATRPLTPREISILQKGMAGIDTAAEAEAFPAGSAKGRKPTGPRGRPRRTAAPRRGKPDPAAIAPRRPKAAQADAPKRGRGKVVEDDWKKRVTVGAMSKRGRAAAAGKQREDETAKPSRPLRPVRPSRISSKAAAPEAAPAAKKPAAPRPRPAAAVSHPLAAAKAKAPAAPARGKPGKSAKSEISKKGARTGKPGASGRGKSSKR
ncbi:MAG: rRNA pseudouridine synthase [Planctomycetaceae bacterium]|nr:rRNA pseudouridine synthase [Planctomycetaceae bacterium]